MRINQFVRGDIVRVKATGREFKIYIRVPQTDGMRYRGAHERLTYSAAELELVKGV